MEIPHLPLIKNNNVKLWQSQSTDCRTIPPTTKQYDWDRTCDQTKPRSACINVPAPLPPGSWSAQQYAADWNLASEPGTANHVRRNRRITCAITPQNAYSIPWTTVMSLIARSSTALTNTLQYSIRHHILAYNIQLQRLWRQWALYPRQSNHDTLSFGIINLPFQRDGDYSAHW